MKKLLTSRPALFGGRAALLMAAALLAASCSKTKDDEALAPSPDLTDTSSAKADKDDKKDEKDYQKWIELWTPYLQSGRAGGSFTVNSVAADAFDQPVPSLDAATLAAHQKGNLAFDRIFSKQKLAPLWVNRSCVACHVGGGRAAAPRVPGPLAPPQLLFRVSQPGTDAQGGPALLPFFGNQIQSLALASGPDSTVIISGEGRVTTTYVEQLKTLTDGSTLSLREPSYAFSVPLPAGSLFSPRTASQVAGLGLLEAVSEADILAIAQNQADCQSFGISGQPNYVWDPLLNRRVLGRFGWKANQPSLDVQIASAYNGDLGITSTVFATEPDGSATPGGVDVSDAERANNLVYTRTLSVPALRTPNDPQVVAGRGLFMSARCAVCHTPVLKTSSLPGFPLVGGQVITPFTDLLLHDMGNGLADNRPDFLATGKEWRTPPLWGLGLSQTTSGHTNLLHDGRARNVLEAIMWHDGEAAFSRTTVEQMSATQRQQLLAFLGSL